MALCFCSPLLVAPGSISLRQSDEHDPVAIELQTPATQLSRTKPLCLDGGQASRTAAYIISPVPVRTTGWRTAHRPSVTSLPVSVPGTPFCSLPSSDFLVTPQLPISLPGLPVLPLPLWHTCDLPHPGNALLPVLGTDPVPSRQRRCEECYLSQPQGC